VTPGMRGVREAVYRDGQRPRGVADVSVSQRQVYRHPDRLYIQ